jgi:hypothetical protein
MSGKTPHQLEAEIEAQREDLAATVDQLADRLDVPARTKRRLADLTDRATTDHGRPRPAVWAAGAAVLAVVTLAVWRTRQGGN